MTIDAGCCYTLPIECLPHCLEVKISSKCIWVLVCWVNFHGDNDGFCNILTADCEAKPAASEIEDLHIMVDRGSFDVCSPELEQMLCRCGGFLLLCPETSLHRNGYLRSDSNGCIVLHYSLGRSFSPQMKKAILSPVNTHSWMLGR